MDDLYVKSQDDLYKNQEDPWQNFGGPRKWLNDRYYAIIKGAIPDECVSVVDIGCGVGKLANSLASYKSVIGVDSSEEAIKKASQLYPSLKFEVGDIRVWRPPSSVDMVLSTGSYYHFPKEERIKCLHHIKSYLNHNGLLLIVYGWDIHFDYKTECYPDISDEVFSVFKKHQCIRYQVIDNSNKEDGSWVFYIGQK
jgi:SAM-dependent methyltransferase